MFMFYNLIAKVQFFHHTAHGGVLNIMESAFLVCHSVEHVICQAAQSCLPKSWMFA